jgi:hypothetical protein
MTPLSEADFWPRVAVDHLRQLLGERLGEFDDGRVAVLICPIDADLGCSAVSMHLTLAEDVVTWSEFGRQVNYQPFVPSGEPDLEFRFERRDYEEVVRGALRRFEALARE